MKKIFFIPLTIALTACVAKSGDAQRAIDDFKVSAHTLIEPEHNNYWKNNFNAYRTYPVNFYTKYNRPADSYDQQRMVNLREYARDTAVSARVGQRMVDSETFTVTENKNTYNYKPSSKGVIYKANSELHIDADKVISPIGEIFVDGSYFLLFEPEQDGRVFLIDGAGQVLPKL
ncbi:MAG: hypothetical protein J6Y91_01275 [Alphaproteobacteria bacterium]|nr:hypothetical protein [Alphaproteobacteria bacterium]